MNHYNLVLNRIIRETLDKLWKKEAENNFPYWRKDKPADFIDQINAGKTYERK